MNTSFVSVTRWTYQPNQAVKNRTSDQQFHDFFVQYKEKVFKKWVHDGMGVLSTEFYWFQDRTGVAIKLNFDDSMALSLIHNVGPLRWILRISNFSKDSKDFQLFPRILRISNFFQGF